VINVGMTDDDRTDLGRIKWELTVTFNGFLASSLIKAAFEKDFIPIHLKQVCGTCRCAGSPYELNAHTLNIAVNTIKAASKRTSPRHPIDGPDSPDLQTSSAC
jgi:hypothetical protein